MGSGWRVGSIGSGVPVGAGGRVASTAGSVAVGRSRVGVEVGVREGQVVVVGRAVFEAIAFPETDGAASGAPVVGSAQTAAVSRQPGRDDCA